MVLCLSLALVSCGDDDHKNDHHGMRTGIHMIQNEKIDEISKVINEDFERLLELQTTNEESVVL